MKVSPRILQDCFDLYRERVAWQGRAGPRSFEALAIDVSLQRQKWRASGLRAGQRIAFYSQDPYRSWIASLAAFGEGAAMGLLPPRLPREQLLPYLATLPFDCWASAEPSPQTGLLQLPLGPLDAQATKPADLEVDLAAPSLLIFSSGSSGQPKAIEHSLGGLVSSAFATLAFYKEALKDAETWLLSLDLAHIGGWQIALRCLLQGLCCVGGYAPQEVGLALREQRCDVLSLVPTQLWRCLAKPQEKDGLLKARAILLGGAACPPELLAAARDVAPPLPLSITYGSSETASQLAAFGPGELPQKASQVGRLLPGWEACLYEGRLALRGAALCRGFWQGGVFHPALQKLGAHGTKLWFLSADRALLKGQELEILGRADHIFQVGGENLAPDEITSPLSELGAAGDWIVVPRTDAQYGEVPVLIYRGEEEPPPRAAVLAVLRARLPGIKLPRALYWHRSAEVSKPSRQLYRVLLSDPTALEHLWNL